MNSNGNSAQSKQDVSSQTADNQPDNEALPNDGHERWEWRTKYVDHENEQHSNERSSEAWKHIKREFGYLSILLLLDFILLGLWYFGVLTSFCAKYALIEINPENFRRLSCCVLMGFMGGIVYDMKILYKAVAHGSWHMDRVIWRIATPWVSVAITIVVICLMKNEVLYKSGYTAAGIGFFAGYYSESAITKLYDIAKIIF